MKQHTTNHINTLILPAEDAPVHHSELPPVKDKPSVANLQLELIAANPYTYTSDDVLFTVFADRNNIPQHKRKEAREEFFSKGQACLRASPLTKRYGWAVHNDAEGKVALVDTSSQEFTELKSDESILKVKAMRSSRK
ncbi:DUF6157 family protein [Flavobacterium silvaticum]|uniref:Uncharacterized protein n=1 Tax=Flavobacterium silvaticum TaxID=1852020 RepID=A0A972FNS3_9FLAO|nr:DUF6157 family protein [Flavobacterium silvaticum]NMH29454.1 hypothetical protein [Flavobacterium silvaticum]